MAPVNWVLPPEWLSALLEGLHAAQQGLRTLCHALGLAPEVNGQPAWPFGYRIAAEMLVVDAGHARRVAMAIASIAVVATLLLLSLLWKRRRKALWLLALALVAITPWPQRSLLFSPAVATSLHQSPTGFTAQSIVRGQAVYAQHCVRCHGANANGDGPDAPALVQWPPTLNGGLLWKRLDGELFWRVRHGMQRRDGAVTMPGVDAQQLSDTQIWQVLDFLQAHAAGQMLREAGTWERPVRVPDAQIDCRHGGRRSLRSLVGQRLRIGVPGAGQGGINPDQNFLQDDPRLVTVLAHAVPGADPPDCVAVEPELLPALGWVLGTGPDTAAMSGHQLIVDRAGWLRARSQPGQAAWSEDDLVCRTPGSGAASVAAAQSSAAPAASDGLDALIRRMDAEPVRYVRGGFPH